ncbi:MAG: hypothetical protein EHM35_01225 [Planctomycetaceae bacterium]|nr:MAG: hypothetical protein EHM35_01225 [Planctomycetaceae bacterium]
MIADREQARDEMLALVAAVVATQTITAVYDDTGTQPPDSTAAWIRAMVKHNTGTRRSLGPNGRHTQSGIIFVQIFTKTGDGQTDADPLVKSLEAPFRGHATTGGVVFKDVYTREIGQSGPWFQNNMIVEFEYDLTGV